MSKRIMEFFLFDIFVAIRKIEQTCKDFRTAQELLYDYKAWDSVIREFEIIGEATKQLINSNIIDDSKRDIVDFRNLLIHNYFGIDPDEVWDIIQNDLKDFKKYITQLIESTDKSLKEKLIDSFIDHNSYLDFIVKDLEKLR